jgi:tRNA(Ile)-lysidine synthase
MKLIDKVRQFARQHDLFHPGTRVVVALSGGSDSVSLLHIVRELGLAGDLELAGVAHFNHQLRPTADRDEQFAANAAGVLGLPFFADRADVSARAAAEGRSIEDAAHVARHEFFERARLHLDADVVAVGHTRDDQAETFLLRLIRGAGLHGLAGMYPRHQRIVRPLLGCSRSELREYLDVRGMTYVDDESNLDVAIARNRVRAELLPLLKSRFNPAVVEVLADEAVLARESWLWMRQHADELCHRAALPAEHPAGASIRELDLLTLQGAAPAVARVALWRVMSEAGAGRPIAFAHVDAVVQLIGSGQDGKLDLPGQHVQRIGARLVLTTRPAGIVGRWSPSRENHENLENPVKLGNRFRYPLSIPGEVQLPEAGYVVSVEPAGLDEQAAGRRAMVGNGPLALVQRDACRGFLAVRNRRTGDQFRPVGVAGKKKLQDFFVDRKVDRRRRDAVPLVVDELDRIVWVAGYGIDEAFRVTDPAQSVLLLRLRQAH